MLTILTPLVKLDPTNRFDLRLTSLAYALQGRIWTSRGYGKLGADAWERAAATLAPVARTSRDFALLEVWAEALLHSARPRDAAPVVGTLREIGYSGALVSDFNRSGLRLQVHDRP